LVQRYYGDATLFDLEITTDINFTEIALCRGFRNEYTQNKELSRKHSNISGE
jgi:hypothetical protein